MDANRQTKNVLHIPIHTLQMLYSLGNHSIISPMLHHVGLLVIHEDKFYGLDHRFAD